MKWRELLFVNFDRVLYGTIGSTLNVLNHVEREFKQFIENGTIYQNKFLLMNVKNYLEEVINKPLDHVSQKYARSGANGNFQNAQMYWNVVVEKNMNIGNVMNL